MNYQPRIPLAPIRLIEIGDAARRLGVTARTLRHYEDQGLVRSHRLARNVRGYDTGTLEQLKAIVALRGVGLPIAAIRDILVLRDQPNAQSEALRKALAEALDEQQAQMARLTDLAARVATDAAVLPPIIAGLQAGTAEPSA
jgi:DNA-binding transcriptional MerR regulator